MHFAVSYKKQAGRYSSDNAVLSLLFFCFEFKEFFLRLNTRDLTMSVVNRFLNLVTVFRGSSYTCCECHLCKQPIYDYVCVRIQESKSTSYKERAN
jgi:hypothetical protein